MLPSRDCHLTTVRRRRPPALPSERYARQRWCRQQRAAAAAAATADTAAANTTAAAAAAPQTTVRQRHRSALPSERYAQKRWYRQQRAAAATASLSEYAPRRRDARKPLSEVQERGDIKHNAGLPSRICTSCGAINYACLSYTAGPERFWCCDGGSTVLPPLGDYPEPLKALLTETAPTSEGGIKRSPRSMAFHSMIR